MQPVCSCFHLDYIIRWLISWVFQSLPAARPSNGLTPQSGLSTDGGEGGEGFLWRPLGLQRQKKKTLCDLTAEGNGPCSLKLQTDKNLEKQHLCYTGRAKNWRIISAWKQEGAWNNDNLAPLVTSCQPWFLWCGCDCSVGINQTYEQMPLYSGRLEISGLFFPFFSP